MFQNVQAHGQLRHSSPLKNSTPPQNKPGLPTDRYDQGPPEPPTPGYFRWGKVAIAGLGVLGAAAGMAQAQQAQVQVQQQQRAGDLLKKLDEYSLKQGIHLEFRAPNPVGGGRRIDAEGAARLFDQGRQVLVAEVTRADGPVRSDVPTDTVRREVYLTGNADLESYSRYFSGETPQNDTERAAQLLKRHVYGQTETTTLMRPGQNPQRPSLSPFAAARRLERRQAVDVRTESQGEVRGEQRLNRFHDLSSVLGLEMPESVPDILQRLDESSLVQGIQLQFRIPSPLGGGRSISSEEAGQQIASGHRVLVEEVTSVNGPFRGVSQQVSREAYLTGQADLESYARYFTNEKPQNETEAAAQKLKKHVYGQIEVTTLQGQDQIEDMPTLSPFAAARRLADELPVSLRVAPDGVDRIEESVVELNSLRDVASAIGQR